MKDNRLYKASVIILTVIISCIFMAIVEMVIEPSYFIKSVLKIVLFLILPLVKLCVQKEKVASYFLRLDKKGLVKLLTLGIGVYAVIMAGFFVANMLFDFSALVASLSADQRVSPSNFIWVAVYISFGNSLLEEFLFRFLGFIKLSEYLSKKVSYIFSSCIFAIYHIAMIGSSFPVPLILLSVAGLAIGGAIFNYVDDKNKSIYNSWIIHMFADFAIMTIWYIHI